MPLSNYLMERASKVNQINGGSVVSTGHAYGVSAGSFFSSFNTSPAKPASPSSGSGYSSSHAYGYSAASFVSPAVVEPMIETRIATQQQMQVAASVAKNAFFARQALFDPPTPPVVETPQELLSSVSDPSDDEFAALVDEGSIAQADGRQTHYFHTHAQPGDGVIATEFVIQAEVSGFVLEGDGREITDDPLGRDPASPHYDLNESRMFLVIDRETGRGAVTSSASSAIFDVDYEVSFDFWGQESSNPFLPDFLDLPITVTSDREVGSRPIVMGPGNHSNWIPEDLVHNQYFNIEADADRIQIDYDAVNSVTAPFHHISVDGPIVLERGSDGTFVAASENDPDLYPSISVVQYHEDGSRSVAYQQTEKNVFEGASPPFIGEVFEAVREITENPIELFTEVGGEFSEGWREVGEASWYRKPDQIAEAAVEVTYETVEGVVETAVDVPWEIAEGTFEVGVEGVKALWNLGN